MQIYGPAQLHGAQSVNAPHSARPQATSGTSAGGSISDSLDISPEAQLVDQANQAREQRLASIKASILDGSYDADNSKLDKALDRLLDHIG